MIPRGSPRPSALAGQWFAASADALATDVANFLEGALPPRELSRVTGILTPHAGLIYSGPTAGRAWGATRHRQPARIVLIGPAHRVGFYGLALGDFSSFVIPTGEVPVDRSALARLESLGLGAFVPYAHDAEHCLEVELPFVHALFPRTPIIPLLVGQAPPREVVAALEAIATPEDLIAISSDLSHFYPYDLARSHDETTLQHVLHLDTARLDGLDACGHVGLQAFTTFERARGDIAVLLDYRTSGDTAGDRRSVVGYGAIAFGPRA